MSWLDLARISPLLSCALLIAACGDSQVTTTDSGGSSSQATSETGGTGSTGGTGGTDTTANPTTGAPTTTGTPTTTDGTSDATTMGSSSDGTTGGPVCPYTPVDGMPGFALEQVAGGFDRPVLAIPDPRDPTRLFVVEQGGRIKILEPGATMAPADSFIDLPVKNKVPGEIGPEQGLLSLAFHPDFPDDPRFYVNYNPGDWQGPGPTYVSEFKLDPNDPDKADMASERIVLKVAQPAANHNGGMIAFGPDGYLYIGMGDGGGANDQFDTGRDFKALHSKMLRIDVEPDGKPDSTKPCGACQMLDGFDYTIPADNPFVGDNNYAPEIWAVGFRNPWRFFFDKDGTHYVGDVGQNTWEEITIASKGSDYGWSLMEGNHCFGNGNCDTSAAPNQVNSQGFTAPIAEYNHDTGCSVTGGAVYHGCEVPGWEGIYFYGDYCNGQVFALTWDGSTVQDLGQVAMQSDRIVGYGYTGFGDVLFTVVQLDDFNMPVDGKILRLVPQ